MTPPLKPTSRARLGIHKWDFGAHKWDFGIYKWDFGIYKWDFGAHTATDRKLK